MDQSKTHKSFNELPTYAKIAVYIFAAVLAIAIIASVFGKKGTDKKISVNEAQTKCILMEESDIMSQEGVELSSSVTERADDYCRSLWNSPDKEAKFIDAITNDWESRKNEKIGEFSLEELYNESIK